MQGSSRCHAERDHGYCMGKMPQKTHQLGFKFSAAELMQ
jgi:hypothetical protein